MKAGWIISIGTRFSIRSPGIPIHDASDPRVAPYRDVRERDLVGRDGHFIAEGEVVLGTLIRSGRHSLVSVLIDERRAEKLSDLFDALPDDVPVYLASRDVIDAIAGFPLHRGILGLGRRAVPPSPEALLGLLAGRRLVLGLLGIANHDNLGGIFRNAAAFGADAILLDSDCCDPFYRKAIRVSVGTTLVLPYARIAPGQDVVGLLSDHGFETLALTPNGGRRLAEYRRPERVAALLGAEGPGLPDAVLARTAAVRIPMASGIDSLNVATTSGIVLHQLTQAAARD